MCLLLGLYQGLQRSKRRYLSYSVGELLCSRLEYLFSRSISSTAAFGGRIPFVTISRFSSFLPYSAALSSRSCRSVAPSRARPANNPCDRDQERMSACICASVWAVAVRPTGPAATEASAPSVNLLESSLSAPRAFITSMIKSVSDPPIWNPILPPSMRTVPGADQPGPTLLLQER